jgi:hypothetical protein
VPGEQPTLEIVDGSPWPHLLRREVTKMFGHRLDRLHEWPHLGLPPRDVDRAQDQSSRAHAQFYRLFPRIEELYRKTALEFGTRVMGRRRPFVVQRVPTFRVHFPQSRAVGEPHTDWQYGHQFGELTFWVPLTVARNSATVWVAERAEGWDKREFQRIMENDGAEAAHASLPEPIKMWPVNLDVGQVLVFDSVTRAHGNLLNLEGLTQMLELAESEGGQIITAAEGAALIEHLRALRALEFDLPADQVAGEALKVRRTWYEGVGVTRVSLDFRILPAFLLERESERRAVNTGVPMTLGTQDKPGYWTDPAEWV